MVDEGLKFKELALPLPAAAAEAWVLPILLIGAIDNAG